MYGWKASGEKLKCRFPLSKGNDLSRGFHSLAINIVGSLMFWVFSCGVRLELILINECPRNRSGFSRQDCHNSGNDWCLCQFFPFEKFYCVSMDLQRHENLFQLYRFPSYIEYTLHRVNCTLKICIRYMNI